jgi:DNA invertase Pin-like site-specific DNA recombinase
MQDNYVHGVGGFLHHLNLCNRALSLNVRTLKNRQAQGIKLAKERKVYKGKKSKFTKADSDKIIALRKTLTVKEIAKTYDCSQRTIYNLIGNNKF